MKPEISVEYVGIEPDRCEPELRTACIDPQFVRAGERLMQKLAEMDPPNPPTFDPVGDITKGVSVPQSEQEAMEYLTREVEQPADPERTARTFWIHDPRDGVSWMDKVKKGPGYIEFREVLRDADGNELESAEVRTWRERWLRWRNLAVSGIEEIEQLRAENMELKAKHVAELRELHQETSALREQQEATFADINRRVAEVAANADEVVKLRAELAKLAEENVLLTASNNGLRLQPTSWDGKTMRELEDERNRLAEDKKRLIETLNAHIEMNRSDYWMWVGDGTDHPESWCNSLVVGVRAPVFRKMLTELARLRGVERSEKVLREYVGAMAGAATGEWCARHLNDGDRHSLFDMAERCIKLADDAKENEKANTP